MICPVCAGPTEVHRIGRGNRRRDRGIDAIFCPQCDLVALVDDDRTTTVRTPAPGYQPRHRKDLDD